MNYPDYIRFLEEFFDLVGEPKKQRQLIKGDFFLL